MCSSWFPHRQYFLIQHLYQNIYISWFLLSFKRKCFICSKNLTIILTTHTEEVKNKCKSTCTFLNLILFVLNPLIIVLIKFNFKIHRLFSWIKTLAVASYSLQAFISLSACHRFSVFLQIDGLCQFCIGKSIRVIFPTASAYFISSVPFS